MAARKSAYASVTKEAYRESSSAQNSAAAPKAPLRKFASNPLNRVVPQGDVDDMAASLVRWGQIQPVKCVTLAAWRRRYPDRADRFEVDAVFVVIAGNIRLLGARQAGLEQLDYTVDDSLLADGRDPAEMVLEENLRRTGLTCMDEARSVRDLMARLGNAVQVADYMGYSRGWVQQRVGLLRLVHEAQDAIDLRAIDFTQARELTSLEPDEQLLLLARWNVGQPADDGGGDTRVSPPAQRKPPSRKAAMKFVRQYAQHHGTDALLEVIADGAGRRPAGDRRTHGVPAPQPRGPGRAGGRHRHASREVGLTARHLLGGGDSAYHPRRRVQRSVGGRRCRFCRGRRCGGCRLAAVDGNDGSWCTRCRVTRKRIKDRGDRVVHRDRPRVCAIADSGRAAVRGVVEDLQVGHHVGAAEVYLRQAAAHGPDGQGLDRETWIVVLRGVPQVDGAVKLEHRHRAGLDLPGPLKFGECVPQPAATTANPTATASIPTPRRTIPSSPDVASPTGDVGERSDNAA